MTKRCANCGHRKGDHSMIGKHPCLIFIDRDFMPEHLRHVNYAWCQCQGYRKVKKDD